VFIENFMLLVVGGLVCWLKSGDT